MGKIGKLPELIMSAVISLFFCLALCSSCGIEYQYAYPALIGVLTAFIVSRFEEKRIGLVLFVSELILPIICLSVFRDSSSAVINHVYEASESVNAYSYYYMNDNGVSSALSASVIAFLLGVLITNGIIMRRPFMLILPGLAVILYEIYFGIMPERNIAVISQGLVISAVVYSFSKGRRHAAIMSVIACVIFAVTALLFPDVNEMVEDYSEYLRDEISQKIEQTAEDIDNKLSDIRGEPENSTSPQETIPTEDDENGKTDYPENAQKPDVSTSPERTDDRNIIPWLLLSAVVILLLIIIAILRLRVKKGRNERKSFDYPNDYNEAVRNLMPYIIKWYGRIYDNHLSDNKSLTGLTAEIENRFGNETADRYNTCVKIWYCVVYGGKNADESDYKRLISLLIEIENLVMSELSLPGRAEARYKYCLITTEEINKRR